MTSIQERFVFSQPATMPDDNMEITSEAGHEDIDIDIDLGLGHVDEDEVLDDAKSETGLDEDYDIQLNSSPVLTHDDIMADEENFSFAMNDVPDQVLQTEIIDVSDFNQLDTDFDGSYDDITILPADTSGSHQANWEQVRKDSGGTTIVGHDQEQDEGSQVGTEDQQKVEQDQSFRISTPDSHAAGGDPAPEVPPTDTDSQQRELTTKSLVGRHERNNSDLLKPEVAQYDTQDVENVDSEHIEESGPVTPTVGQVIVMYRDAEYALVPSSESDHPDSYFLKDDSLTRAPLSEFLLALKEVILGDLGPDDEVCLAVNDFCVEINETSTPAFHMTLAKILDLHANLLRNDGINKPGPMYITLGTKPSFSKRLISLADGASEGKGLSELVTWDDGSDSFPEDHSELVEDHLSRVEGDTEGEHAVDGQIGSRIDETPIYSASQHRSEEAELGGETASSTELHFDPGLTEDEHKHDSTQDGAIATHGKNQEEEDLIDYEDDDYEEESDPVPADSSTDQNVEHEESNEDPSRRSLSPAATDVKAGVSLGNDAMVFEEPFTENGALSDHSFEHGNATFDENDATEYADHLDIQQDDGEVPDSEARKWITEEVENVWDSTFREQPNTDDPFGSLDDAGLYQGNETDANEYLDMGGEEELDFGLSSDNPEYREPENDEVGTKILRAKETGLTVDEISYGVPDETHGSIESEQTLVAEGSEMVQNDEISYEDDDVPTTADSSRPQPATTVSYGTTGKRSRTDGDDAMEREVKDTKRVRS